MKHFLNNFPNNYNDHNMQPQTCRVYETYSIWQVAITHRRNCIISNPTIDRSFTSTLMTAKQSLYIYWSYLPLSKFTQSYLYCSQSDAKATKTVVSCRILETNSAMLKIQAAYTTKNTALLTLKKKKRKRKPINQNEWKRKYAVYYHTCICCSPSLLLLVTFI